MPTTLSERAATGVEGLDYILLGGLPRNHLYLIEGDPGSGKTTLALQFLREGLQSGERVLYVTLSETRAEIDKIAASHGWSMEDIHVTDLASTLGTVTDEDQYTVFRPSEVELGETSKRIVAQVEELRPHRVVIDSLSEVRLLAGDPLRYRRQILGLKQFFAGRECTVVVLDDRTTPESDSQPQSIAHGIISLDRVPIEFGSERRRIRVDKMRGSDFRGGYHDMGIVRGGLIVYPRLTAAAHMTKFDPTPMPTGLNGFDLLLGGGLDPGTSTLITGPAGTGKSSLATKVAHSALTRGLPVAFFAFEENQRIATGRARSLGTPLDEHLDSGLATFKHINPAELSPGELAWRVREAVEVQGAKVVIIDSLNGYLNAMPEERFLSAQLHELLGYLNHRGVVTLMVLVQRGMMGAGMTAPVDLSYLADGIVLLRHFEAFGAVRKAISVAKKRTGAHESTIRELRFGPQGVIIGDVLSDFRGVLTGVPVYVGNQEGLIGDRSSASNL